MNLAFCWLILVCLRAMSRTIDLSEFEGLWTSLSDFSSDAKPVNEFVIQALLDETNDFLAIERLLSQVLDSDEDFSPTLSLLELVQGQISSDLYAQLQPRYHSDAATEVEFLYKMNQDFLAGLRSKAEQRKRFMKGRIIDGHFVILPDLCLILRAWNKKYEAGQGARIEDHLAARSFPNWFVGLCKAMEASHADSLLRSVYNHVQDELYALEVQGLLLNYIHDRIFYVTRTNSPSCLGRRRRSKRLFDESFLATVASIHVPEDVLIELCEILGLKPSSKVVKELLHLNSL